MVPTLCHAHKSRPDLRAGLSAARRRIVDNAVRHPCFVLNADGTRDPCSDFEDARRRAHARAWGDIGTEYWAVMYAEDASGTQVCLDHERFIVEVVS